MWEKALSRLRMRFFIRPSSATKIYPACAVHCPAWKRDCIGTAGRRVGINSVTRSRNIPTSNQPGTACSRTSFCYLSLLLDQFVAPQLQQKAISARAVALEKSAALGKGLGIWTRDERNILRIGEMVHAARAADIEIMHFDENGFLKSFTHAKYADFIGGDLWELSDVTTKTFTGNRIESVRMQNP